MVEFSERINHALRIAARAHEGQYRKGSDTPYVAHPVAVALISQRYYSDEEVFIAALLHDVLEDVPKWTYSESDMRRDFGDAVTEIVKDVSEPRITAPMLTAWLHRKSSYVEHIAATDNPKSLVVSASDKIHNMAEILREYHEKGEGVWRNFHVDKGHEIWFFDEVFQALRQKTQLGRRAIADYENLLSQLKELDANS